MIVDAVEEVPRSLEPAPKSRLIDSPVLRFIVRRLLHSILVVWTAFTVSFFGLYWLPGDAVAAKLATGDASNFDPQAVDELRAKYGLDKSIFLQYADKLGDAVRGDLGVSVRTSQPVTTAVADVIPRTVTLAAAALALSVVIGGGIAFASTYTRRRWLRQLLSAIPPLGVSVPTFWTGLMLIYFVSFKWELLPSGGNQGGTNLILPAITLALPGAAMIAQVLANSLRNTLREPYIETARAKGVSRRAVHVRHALRNALLPVVTIIGLVIMHLLAGSAVVETIFTRAGVGNLTIKAVTNQDLPVIQGIVVLSAVAFVVLNLIIDLIYPLLDPRISLVGSLRRRVTGDA